MFTLAAASLVLYVGSPPGAGAVGTSVWTAATLSITTDSRGDAADPLQLQIEVSYKGFDKSADLVIEAVEGQLVELTFVWADPSVPDNSHRIYIKGYDVKTGLLTAANPAETLTFAADQAGDFEIVCDWECFGHDVLVAHLRVGGAGGGSAAAARPTRLMGSTRQGVPAGDGERGESTLTATLLDDRGQPIADAPIVFEAAAELTGVTGFIEVGRAVTDARGVATFPNEMRTADADQSGVRVRFLGVGVYGESVTETFAVVPAASAAGPAEATPLRAVTPWLRAVLFLIVLAIWLTMAFVAYQLLRIGREPVRGATQKEAVS